MGAAAVAFVAGFAPDDDATSSPARRTSALNASWRVESNVFDVDCMFRISRGAVPRLKKNT
jgi:hypothetical protein